MRKEVIAPLTALVFSIYSNQSYADLNDFLNKAKQKAAETTNSARERVKESAESTREKVKGRYQEQQERFNTEAEKLRENARRGAEDLGERAQREFESGRERTEQYYQQNLEPRVREEARKFSEDPKGYSLDLGKRINRGVIKFEDIASDGIAQGFVNIEYKKGQRLGSLIEDRLGIKETYTKKGAKIAVLYLMGTYPDFMTTIPIINAGDLGYSIEEAENIPRLREKAIELRQINRQIALLYNQGKIYEAQQQVQNFGRALQEVNRVSSIGLDHTKSTRRLFKEGLTLDDIIHAIKTSSFKDFLRGTEYVIEYVANCIVEVASTCSRVIKETLEDLIK